MTILDAASPKQIERFLQFKQTLLEWKNSHSREYTAFVRHMNSDSPEAMAGLAQLLVVVCPEISCAMAECWNDDTLSANDWIERLSKDVSLSGLFDGSSSMLKDAPNSEEENITMEDAMKEAREFVRQNGSIEEFTKGIMKNILGDTPIPKEMDDFLTGVIGELQANVDRMTSGEPIDHNAVSEAMDNIQGVFNECRQQPVIGSALHDTAKWVSDIKLQNPDHFLPLLLTWLIHGRAFEKIVTVLNEQAAQTSWPMNQTILDAAVEAVASSVENAYRTPGQWRDFFELFPNINPYIISRSTEICLAPDEASVRAEQVVDGKPGRSKGVEGSLSQYLTCANPNAVLKILEKFIKAYPAANDIALTAIVLRSLNLIPDLTEDKETSSAIHKEFSQSIPDLKAESSIRKALGLLRGTIVKTDKTGAKKMLFQHDIEPHASKKQHLFDRISKVI